MLHRKGRVILSLIEDMEDNISQYRSRGTDARLMILQNVKYDINNIIPNVETSIDQLILIDELIQQIQYEINPEIVNKILTLQDRIADGEAIILKYERNNGRLPTSVGSISLEAIGILFSGISKVNTATEEWIQKTEHSVKAISRLPQPRVISRALNYLKKGAPLLNNTLKAISAVAPIFAAIL